jgi:hypothetical protein
VDLPAPSVTPKLTQVTTTATTELSVTYQDSWYRVAIAEVCYDGVVYLTTAKGGISVKLIPTSGDSASGSLRTAYLQTCK